MKISADAYLLVQISGETSYITLHLLNSADNTNNSFLGNHMIIDIPPFYINITANTLKYITSKSQQTFTVTRQQHYW